MLAGPRKCLKQIIQIALNRVKNPNWPSEANPLAIYKHGRGFELGTTMNKSSWQSGRDLNSGPQNCKFGALTTWQRCLLFKDFLNIIRLPFPPDTPDTQAMNIKC